MKDYKRLMKKCIALAKKGAGNVSPNPLVACIVLNKENEIISTGYHQKYGENHAERNALLKLKNGEEKDGTLIVNLEPCSHYGKTPPCADLIIERELKRVIIGCNDTNPKVCGNGIKKLKDANIEVITGVLEKECQQLNEIFFTNINEQRTFVALKTATTLDGKIATHNGNSKWITSDKSRKYVRKIRKKYDAILTSSETVIADNPEMKHKNKIILDKELKTDLNSKIYQQGNIYLVVKKDIDTSKINKPNITLIKCPTKNNQLDLTYLLKQLFELKIMSILVEAGGTLNGSFIKDNLVDKIYHFIAPKILNDNSGKSCYNGDLVNQISQCKNFNIDNTKKIGNDILITYYKQFI